MKTFNVPEIKLPTNRVTKVLELGTSVQIISKTVEINIEIRNNNRATMSFPEIKNKYTKCSNCFIYYMTYDL